MILSSIEKLMLLILNEKGFAVFEYWEWSLV